MPFTPFYLRSGNAFLAFYYVYSMSVVNLGIALDETSKVASFLASLKKVTASSWMS